MTSVVCIGSILIDELFFCHEQVIAGTSNPATSIKSIGGVMSNIVRNLTLLGTHVDFISITGNDAESEYLKSSLLKSGVKTDHIQTVDESTGKYVSILNADGSLFAAVCADNCAAYITPELLITKSHLLLAASLLIADTNLDIPVLEWLISFARDNNKKLIIEPVSVLKASKLSTLNLDGVFMVTPNEDELVALTNHDSNDESDLIKKLLGKGVKNIWLRKGAKGSVFYNEAQRIELSVPEIIIKDSTGAGDAALAGWIVGYLDNKSFIDAMKMGHCMAFEVLQTIGSVNNNITKEKLSTVIDTYYHE